MDYYFQDTSSVCSSIIANEHTQEKGASAVLLGEITKIT